VVKLKNTTKIETIIITDTPPPGAEEIQSQVKLEVPEQNIGLVVNMNAPMMNSENYSLGL